MAEAYKKQLNDVQLELLNNRQHMINTEAQWRKRVEEVETRERLEVARVKSQAQNDAAAAKSALEGMNSGVGGSVNLDGSVDRRRGNSTSPRHRQNFNSPGGVGGGGGGGGG
ncbi:unnamed protein product, partial [Choristocarpus tenellus]